MTALDGYGDFDTKRLSSKPVNTILDKADVFLYFRISRQVSTIPRSHAP